MKLRKFVISSVFMLCIFLSCGSKSNTTYIHLLYDKKCNILAIRNRESAWFIKKVELDRQQDTLLISKITKELVSFVGKKNDGKSAVCYVKLPSDIEFVKLGDALFTLSNMDEFSFDDIAYSYGLLYLAYPKKFPCVIY